MYLQDLIGDKGALIARALQHPTVRKRPIMELALKQVLIEVEKATVESVKEQFAPQFAEVHDMYTIMNGDFEECDAEQRDDWESGLDDEVEKLLQPYAEYLSASWLGDKTVDTRLYEDGQCEKLAASMGKEVYKELSYKKEPGQTLSNAGIFKEEVQTALDNMKAPKSEEEKEAMAETQADRVTAVLEKIYARIGTGFDMMEVYDDFDFASDDDDILADAAGKRLGLDDHEDIVTLQMARMELGDDPAQKLIELVIEVGKTVEAGKKAKPAAPKPPKVEKAAAPDADALDIRVIALMKEHSSIQDTKFSAELGVSRSTYNNWLAGKTPLVPTDEQKATIRERLVADLNGLHEALAVFDGTTQDVVS